MTRAQPARAKQYPGARYRSRVGVIRSTLRTQMPDRDACGGWTRRERSPRRPVRHRPAAHTPEPLVCDARKPRSLSVGYRVGGQCTGATTQFEQSRPDSTERCTIPIIWNRFRCDCNDRRIPSRRWRVSDLANMLIDGEKDRLPRIAQSLAEKIDQRLDARRSQRAGRRQQMKAYPGGRPVVENRHQRAAVEMRVDDEVR